jgi:hypothetical protein
MLWPPKVMVLATREDGMSARKGKTKGPQSRGKKLAVKKDAIKDLQPRKGVRAGAAAWRDPLQKLATNHNEILVADTMP